MPVADSSSCVSPRAQGAFTGASRFARAVTAVVAIAAASLGAGCQRRPMKVPGETDILVQKVEILPAEGQDRLTVPHEALFDRLGMRPGTLIITPRYYSEFREAEDRRRIEAFWQQYGFLDVDVTPAKTVFSEDRSRVSVSFTVRENTRYKIGEVHLSNVSNLPEEEVKPLLAMIPFSTGETEIDLEKFRRIRNDMHEHLRREGYGHANVYSRAYIDRGKKIIHWYYFVDAGPRTTIASIKVVGNVKVPAEKVIARTGLKVGDPYKEGLRDTASQDLLDTGAFNSTFVRTDTDTKFVVPGSAPDTGGELRDEQIDDKGNVLPRKLPPGINLTLHVVEAPSRTLRVRSGFEIDPARADASLGATLWLRNLFYPYHHLVVEGRLAYGLLFDQSLQEPKGVYGDALIRSVHAGLLGRTGDFRVSAGVRTELFPNAYLVTLFAGPGVRSTLGQGTLTGSPGSPPVTTSVFLDVDLYGVYSQSTGFSSFSASDRERFALPDTAESANPELSARVIWDARDNPVEAKKGHYLGLSARFSPGEPIGTHRYLNIAPEARAFWPLNPSFSVAGRVAAEWSFLHDDAGVPLGARLFGGGAYGFRGVGRQRLSPVTSFCAPLGDGFACNERFVGGLSLFESSAELRFLPPNKQYGLVVFADFGGAGAAENPFEDGPSFAAGLGLRLRLWYLPIAIDVAYRAVSRGAPQGLEDNPISAFVRIGEAF